MVSRIEGKYFKRLEETPLPDTCPSEYITDFYFGTQPLDRVDRLLYASDYPDWVFDRPSTINELLMLDDEERPAILTDNAEEVFGL